MGPHTRVTIPPFLVGMLMIGIVPLGCTQSINSGTDTQKLESLKIEKNKTTEQELVASLGPPQSSTDRGDGTTILTWSGVSGQSHDATAMIFVPVVGGFFAHANVNATTRSLSVTVRNGIVVDYTEVTSNQNTTLN
jgi:hypothetical protein